MAHRVDSGADADAQKRRGDEPVDPAAADRFEAVHQAEARKPGQRKSAPVKLSFALAAGVRNEDQGEPQSGEAERDVEQENPMPRAVSGDEPAERRADYRRRQGRP